MTLCETLSEKMPAVQRGLAGWTPEEAAHLAQCADCRLEWEVVSAGAAMGAVEGRLDAEMVARQVLGRLEEARRRRRVGPAWGVALAAAATLVILVWPGKHEAPVPATAGEAGSLELPLAELEGVEADVLQDVLDGLGNSAGQDGQLEGPGFSDLDPSELEQLLRTMEG